MAAITMHMFVCPIAQLAEHWTPSGDSLGLIRSSARYMGLLMGMVCSWWEQPQLVEVS